MCRYTDATIAEAMQSAACMVRHGTLERLARLLLRCADGCERDDFSVADDVFATVLGVRERDLIIAARTLQSLHAVRYEPGRYSAIDRRELQKLSCECYSIIKRRYGAMTRPRAP